MKYSFESEYITEKKFLGNDIVKVIAEFFLAKYRYVEFEGVNFNTNDTYSFCGILNEEEIKEVLSFLSKDIQIYRFIINDFDIKDGNEKFALYDSVYNWNLSLSNEELTEFNKYLLANKLRKDLFFPETQWIKRIVNNPLDKILRFLGFHTETSKFFTPRQKRNNN